VLALGLASPAVGQQDFVLPYSKTPETAPEFWAATKYELGLGNHNRTAQMLGNFYDKAMALSEDDQRKLLLGVYDADGMSTFLRLSTIPAVKQVLRKDPATQKDVPAIDLLIARTTKLVETRLSDPERIRFFVGQLNKRAEERAYAISQLRASGPRSVPAMIEVLRDPAQQAYHGPIFSALLKMDSDIGPPLLAALDSKSDFIKSVIVDVFAQRADNRIVPDLFYLSAARSSTPALAAKAKEWLTRFLQKEPRELGDPRASLVAAAERYHQHQVDLAGQQLFVWTWNEEGGLTGRPATATEVEESRGIAYARKALDLDPNYTPAQVELLSLALDKAYERHGPTVNLAKAAPELHALLAASPAELLERVLTKALKDRRANSALGAVKALAMHGDPGLLRLTEKGSPPLLQAMLFPDRRVRFAAAESALAVNRSGAAYPGNSRVVEVLRHAITGGGPAKAFVGLGDKQEANRLAGLLRPFGFEAEVVPFGNELLARATTEGNVSLIVTDTELPNPGFKYFLSQYKTNPNTAGVPLLLIAERDLGRYAQDELASVANVRIIPKAPLSPEMLKAEINALGAEKPTPPLTDSERVVHAKLAVEYLARIASGELKGYDLRPADAALIQALNDDVLAPTAAQALAHRNTREAQAALAAAVLSEEKAMPIRVAIAPALRANIQRFGRSLDQNVVQNLIALAGSAKDPALKEQADLTVATVRADATAIGNRLKGFVPSATPAAAPKKVEPGRDGS
jgi:hypothetical protein